MEERLFRAFSVWSAENTLKNLSSTVMTTRYFKTCNQAFYYIIIYGGVFLRITLVLQLANISAQNDSEERFLCIGRAKSESMLKNLSSTVIISLLFRAMNTPKKTLLRKILIIFQITSYYIILHHITSYSKLRPNVLMLSFKCFSFGFLRFLI